MKLTALLVAMLLTAAALGRSATIGWPANSVADNVVSYRVYQGLSQTGVFNYVTTVNPAASLSVSLTNLATNSVWVRVSAVTTTEESPLSTALLIPASPNKPATPTNTVWFVLTNVTVTVTTP